MNDVHVIKAALLGAGTVGSGVYDILQWQKDEMPKKLGAVVELKKILVRDTKKQREGMDSSLFTDNWKEILEDPEIRDRHRGHGRHRTGQDLYHRGAACRQACGDSQQGPAGGARQGGAGRGGGAWLRPDV